MMVGTGTDIVLNHNYVLHVVVVVLVEIFITP